MNCRFCQNNLSHEFVDLGFSPPSNAFLTALQLNEPETAYPLKIMVCEKCFLVQIDEFAKHDAIFNSEYVYFSSYSKSWLAHAEAYTHLMIEKFGYNEKHQVIEIASNDGYLLQYFKKKGVPVLGIEPTSNTAEAAKEKGIDSVVDFFGVRLAKELVSKNIKADLLLGNNVLAHVPDIKDFVGGMKIILNTEGVITMEFPHLMQLIDKNQFDTIYHEHFSYLSFHTVKQIFEAHGLVMFDVEEIPTHGGSLRIYAKHKADKTKGISRNVSNLLKKEVKKGLNDIKAYEAFQPRALKVKVDLWAFLLKQHNAGKKVAAYGAAAKGNTLLNYCGISNDLISFVVDANPHKQSKFLPASHIPVVKEDRLKTEKPDYVIILPWNLSTEITEQLSYIRQWGGKFVIPIPKLKII
jgi:C-methyltransferase C-terminal domain/Putative zinc binding domain/Methyltransferase domain